MLQPWIIFLTYTLSSSSSSSKREEVKFQQIISACTSENHRVIHFIRIILFCFRISSFHKIQFQTFEGNKFYSRQIFSLSTNVNVRYVFIELNLISVLNIILIWSIKFSYFAYIDRPVRCLLMDFRFINSCACCHRVCRFFYWFRLTKNNHTWVDDIFFLSSSSFLLFSVKPNDFKSLK